MWGLILTIADTMTLDKNGIWNNGYEGAYSSGLQN